MEVLVVGHEDVRRLLTMPACVDVMVEALETRGRGEVQMPLRQVLWLEGGDGALAWMPAAVRPTRLLGAKILTVFPGNSRTPYESHQGLVVLFESEHGRLLAMLDAAALTDIRTAAVSAAATRALARPTASRLAILGNGRQAALHVEAMCAVRAIATLSVWGRHPERALRFGQAMAAKHGLEVVTAASVEAAVRGAEIVCATTASREVILRGEWLAPGCHVNAVGAAVPGFRELDSVAVARSRLFVDARESALAEADEVRIALAEGAITAEHIVGDLGELFLGTVEGRRGDDEITLFKSLGLAVEDLAAARYVYERATAEGAGSRVEFAAARGHD